MNLMCESAAHRVGYDPSFHLPVLDGLNETVLCLAL